MIKPNVMIVSHFALPSSDLEFTKINNKRSMPSVKIIRCTAMKKNNVKNKNFTKTIIISRGKEYHRITSDLSSSTKNTELVIEEQTNAKIEHEAGITSSSII
jgi:hypothetical protein